MERDNDAWIDHLSSPGARQEAALADLGKILRRGLDGALGRRIPQRDAFLDDTVQDSLVKLLASLDTFQGRSRFTTWAVAVAVREALGELRRKRFQDLSFDELTEGGGLQLPLAAQEDAVRDDRLDRGRVLTALQQLIDERLTRKQRTVLRAKLEGLDASEIARRLPGVRRNAVYKLAHDARRSLKQGLLEAGFGEETVRHAFDF